MTSYPIRLVLSGSAKSSISDLYIGKLVGLTIALKTLLAVSILLFAVLTRIFTFDDGCLSSPAILLRPDINEAVAPVSRMAVVV